MFSNLEPVFLNFLFNYIKKKKKQVGENLDPNDVI